MKRCLSILLVALTVAPFASAKDPEVLPPAFNGWTLDRSSVSSSSNPAQADAANAAVLQEYGFTGYETGTYTRNGHKTEIKAARFNDASGAYGAFTYYVRP